MCGVPLAGLTAPVRPSQITIPQEENFDAHPQSIFRERGSDPSVRQRRAAWLHSSTALRRLSAESQFPPASRGGRRKPALLPVLSRRRAGSASSGSGICCLERRAARSTTALPPQTPPAVADQQSAQPAPAQQPVAPPKSAAPVTAHEQSTTAQRASAGETAKAEKPRPAVLTRASSAPALTAPPVSTAAGAQELAVAEGYLNGTNGQQRNSAAAAQWLWKAVEKRNTEATLLLSDLYLKGDGVSKNCDQAHVLLDAAASRGVRDAAVRLRNLRAFGCE